MNPHIFNEPWEDQAIDLQNEKFEDSMERYRK